MRRNDDRVIVRVEPSLFVNEEKARVSGNVLEEICDLGKVHLFYLMDQHVLCLCRQGDVGPFNPGLPVDVPVWLALNLKQRQKCRIVPPDWMDVGKILTLLTSSSGNDEVLTGTRIPDERWHRWNQTFLFIICREVGGDARAGEERGNVHACAQSALHGAHQAAAQPVRNHAVTWSSNLSCSREA